MLKKGEPTRIGDLGDRAQVLFVQLKSKVATPSVLLLLRYGRRFVLDTDACDIEVDCNLMQLDEQKSLRPVGFSSRMLFSVERIYDDSYVWTRTSSDTWEHEYLPIGWSVFLLIPYLQHDKFPVKIDHRPSGGV